MLNKKMTLIFGLASMTLMTACGGGKKDDAPVRKADSDMIIITENYAEDGHYTDSLDNSWTYSYHVPQLTADTVGARAINAAIEAADVVFMRPSLDAIPKSIKIARITGVISGENVVLALAVKLLVLVLGMLGFANIWAAVFADTGVAMLCILNSLRILLKKLK